MDFASWKDRKVLAGALKVIYRAKDADLARLTGAGLEIVLSYIIVGATANFRTGISRIATEMTLHSVALASLTLSEIAESRGEILDRP
jgi:hypothetical protein